VLTSRAEPFEGINETIVFSKECHGEIDDFRAMTIWKGDSVERFTTDQRTLVMRVALQPFIENRETGVKWSCQLLMLFIRMVVTDAE